MVTLAGERGLLLVGQPGTAKSMLGELLAAAISGSSALTIQGTAGANEDHLRYGWNYAMLLDRGPRPEALVASPVLTAMRTGRLVRIEEITRCLPEVQDALISVLSERRMMIPELEGKDGSVFAAPGFNVIATANLRDRGVSEMSAALKRRLNFETVPPIADARQETDLVRRRAIAVLRESGTDADVDARLLEILVTTFRDLREGRTEEGWSVERPASVMSTAEAVTVAAAITRQGAVLPRAEGPRVAAAGLSAGRGTQGQSGRSRAPAVLLGRPHPPPRRGRRPVEAHVRAAQRAGTDRSLVRKLFTFSARLLWEGAGPFPQQAGTKRKQVS